MTINVINHSFNNVCIVINFRMASSAIASKVGALSSISKGLSGTNRLLAVASLNQKVLFYDRL